MFSAITSYSVSNCVTFLILLTSQHLLIPKNEVALDSKSAEVQEEIDRLTALGYPIVFEQGTSYAFSLIASREQFQGIPSGQNYGYFGLWFFIGNGIIVSCISCYVMYHIFPLSLLSISQIKTQSGYFRNSK